MRTWFVAFSLVAWVTILAGVAAAATQTIHVGSYYFEDATVGDGTVVAKTGDRLAFVFDDSGSGGKRHSAVVTELGIDSGPQPRGATWTSPVLTTPGTFRLFCRFHQTANNHWTTLVVTGAAITPVPAPTATPKSTPKPTPAPTATAKSSATPAPSSGATATGTLQPSASAVGSPAPTGSAGPDESPATSNPDQSEGAGSGGPDDGNGGSGPTPTTWLRSVWVGLLAAIPIAAVAWFAAALARRRQR